MKKTGQRSSLVDLFNSLNNASDHIKSAKESQNPPQISLSNAPQISRKKFPGQLESTVMFEEKTPGFDEEKDIESQEIRKTFDGLEKWTNNWEQRKSTF